MNRRTFLSSLLVPVAVPLLPKLPTPAGTKGIDPRDMLNKLCYFHMDSGGIWLSSNGVDWTKV